jgi:hypothetical protein
VEHPIGGEINRQVHRFWSGQENRQLEQDAERGALLGGNHEPPAYDLPSSLPSPWVPCTVGRDKHVCSMIMRLWGLDRQTRRIDHQRGGLVHSVVGGRLMTLSMERGQMTEAGQATWNVGGVSHAVP